MNNINSLLGFYKSNEWWLIPLQPKKKEPIGGKWDSNKSNNINTWNDWILKGYNIGLLTGKINNITVLDFDIYKHTNKPVDIVIPNEIESKYPKTLIQITQHGYHFIYKYIEQLKNQVNLDNLIDVRNDNGYIVVSPCQGDNLQRSFMNINMSINVLTDNIIKEFANNQKPTVETKINETGRHGKLLELGGIFRKELTSGQVKYVLQVLNKQIFKQPLNNYEIDRVASYLDNAHQTDYSFIKRKILEYLKSVKTDKTCKDIQQALKETPYNIDIAIGELLNNNEIVRINSKFKIFEEVKWQTNFIDKTHLLDIKVPYLNDFNYYRSGDIIIIGAPTGFGKTHIALNMIKQFCNQGVKPYYICTEAGGRYASVAQELQLQVGDFYFCETTSPQNVYFEKNAVTIIDWVLPENYAESDKLFKVFSDQMQLKGGLLVVFVQLKTVMNKEGKYTYDFYAKDMIHFFATVAVKYQYLNEDRTEAEFVASKVRESKYAVPGHRLPVKYNIHTKIIEVNNEPTQSTNVGLDEVIL